MAMLVTIATTGRRAVRFTVRPAMMPTTGTSGESETPTIVPRNAASKSLQTPTWHGGYYRQAPVGNVPAGGYFTGWTFGR